MLKYLLLSFGAVCVLGCQADPSTYKVPRPEKDVVKKVGKVSTYNPAVDILFVIDVSGSMSDYQQRLSENSSRFIDQFLQAKFVDYHIGVTGSHDPSFLTQKIGKLVGERNETFVSRLTPDGPSVLQTNLDVGIWGGGTEEFLNVPIGALAPSAQKSFNKGFYRQDAHLLIFVLTDTEDQSDVLPQQFYDFLLNLKNGDRSKLHFAGAIVNVEKKECLGEGDQGTPRRLHDTIALFQSQGHMFNICKDNYGDDLARVGANIVKAVSTVYLEELPDIKSLEVFLGDQLLTKNVDWVYDFDINGIRLSPELDVSGTTGDVVNVSYSPFYSVE